MIHSLMATVVVGGGSGEVEFFEVLPILFGDCFEFVCIFFVPPPLLKQLKPSMGS